MDYLVEVLGWEGSVCWQGGRSSDKSPGDNSPSPREQYHLSPVWSA